MTLLRLAICVAGIYASFISWALIQERLSTTPYPDPSRPGESRFFRSAVLLNTVQSAFSAVAAVVYLYLRDGKRKPKGFLELVGLDERYGKAVVPRSSRTNGTSNGHHGDDDDKPTRASPAGLLLRCLQCALLHSLGSPLGFASVRHLDYPTVLLGKACKLVPVMLMNVVLYRRKFAPHKYLVVSLVTLGLALFMLCGDGEGGAKGKKGKGAEKSSLWGLMLLTANLVGDGAVNSTQDEIFSRYTIDGGHLMFLMNTLSTVLTLLALVLPLHHLPFLPASSSSTELRSSLDFIRSHPTVLNDILLFSLAGATGQLFIFSTLASFGSLTLVTITVTRKLATMLLSVFVFDHRLAPGQWLGIAVVFGAVGLEAWVKMGHGRMKRVIAEDEKKAKVKEI